MKKEMFNLWYNEYGKELAKKVLPIDDVEEKEIRRKAKEIFSYTYNMFSDFMCEKLSPMFEDIIAHLTYLNDICDEINMKKFSAERVRDEITPHMTELYDSYYKEKSIKKEQFDSLKSHFGKILSNAKDTIRECDTMLTIVKKEKKDVESLLVTE